MQSPIAMPIGSQTVALNPNYSNVNNKNRAATVRPSTSATRRPLGNLASEFASQQEDCSDAYVGRDQGALAKIKADPR